MFVIDFENSPAAAFWNGFIKGMAAPVSLYHNEPAPGIPSYKFVEPPSVEVGLALSGDWVKIGADMNKVIYQHGQTDKKAA